MLMIIMIKTTMIITTIVLKTTMIIVNKVDDNNDNHNEGFRVLLLPYSASLSKLIPLDASVVWDPVYDSSSLLSKDHLCYGEGSGQEVDFCVVMLC